VGFFPHCVALEQHGSGDAQRGGRGRAKRRRFAHAGLDNSMFLRRKF
jgi:hypothetical protein